MKDVKQIWVGAFVFLFLALVLIGCGTRTGNSGTVSVVSEAYDPAAAVSMGFHSLPMDTSRFAAPVSDLKLCVTMIKMKGLWDEEMPKDGSSEIKFEAGLIDLTSGAEEAWGNAEVPVDFKLTRLQVQVRKDTALCGTNYSVKFNGFRTHHAVNFKWRFDPAIEVESGDTLVLSLATLIRGLRDKDDDGDLSDDNIKESIEGNEEHGSKKGH